MANPESSQNKPEPSPRRRPRRGRFGPGMLVFPLFLGLILWVFGASLTGQSITLPPWVAASLETRITSSMGRAGVRLSGAELRFDREGTANLVLRDVALRDAKGTPLGVLNELGAKFNPVALLRPSEPPSKLHVSGAQITVRRSNDGAFSLSLGGAGGAEAQSLADTLDMIDSLFSQAPLSGIAEIAATDVTIILEDARSARIWHATNGTITLRNSPERVEIDVFSEVFNGTENLARVQLSFGSAKGARTAEISASLVNAAAADLALQSPALAYLAVLDAPVSGAVRTTFGSDAELESLAATLDIGQGSLDPGGANPVDFDEGRVYLSYDPDRARLDLTEVAVQGERVRLRGEGHALLDGLEDGWPDSLTAQLRFSEIAAVARGVFAEEVGFAEGRADFRVRLDPFRVEIGQAVLLDGDTRLAASGSIRAEEKGWNLALDATGDGFEPKRLLGLWPINAIPGTRTWLTENLLGGDIGNITAALRLAPGADPLVGVTYDYANAQVRFLPHFPPVTGGRGSASLTGDVFAMHLDEGSVDPGQGGPVDLTGSTIRITELDRQPALMEIGLRAAGTLEAALTMMDNRPFEVLKKIGKPADLAEGQAEVEARIGLYLRERVEVDDVDFSVAGRVTDVFSTTLAPNRTLTADALDLSIDPRGLRLSGPVSLDGVAANAWFTQPFGQGSLPPAEVNAALPLSQDTLDRFGIALPRGMIEAEGEGTIRLLLPPDGPPEFWLNSSTEGLALSVPALGWRKPAATEGQLRIAGRLGPVPEIDTLFLVAPGLSARGAITLGEGGRFVSADFERIVAGDWLSVPIRLVGRGPDLPPRVEITGGLIDIRNLPEFDAASGPPVPISVALDRLVVTEDLAATGLRAELSANRGLNGRFTAKVNNGADIEGELIPQPGGTAIRVRGNDAGRTFREGGIFRFARDGTFEAALVPRTEGRGYDGQLRVIGTRLNNQPAVMDFLDAISIVGIIDQLQGAGIRFEEVQARFRMLPDRIHIDQASAVGASIGVSLDGTVYTAAKKLDLQGVLSPIYLLNVVGSPFTRRGEGLFGVTFRVTGDTGDPSISANPLSLLAPGGLRDIFRRPAPAGTEPATRQRRPSQHPSLDAPMGGSDDR